MNECPYCLSHPRANSNAEIILGMGTMGQRYPIYHWARQNNFTHLSGLLSSSSYSSLKGQLKIHLLRVFPTHADYFLSSP